jgi:hypothetical protein
MFDGAYACRGAAQLLEGCSCAVSAPPGSSRQRCSKQDVSFDGLFNVTAFSQTSLCRVWALLVQPDMKHCCPQATHVGQATLHMWFAQLYSCVAHALSMVGAHAVSRVVCIMMAFLYRCCTMLEVLLFGLCGCLYIAANFVWHVVGAC